MKNFKAYQDFSVFDWKTVISRIFDLRWEQALLSTSDPPSDKMLEGLCVST